VDLWFSDALDTAVGTVCFDGPGSARLVPGDERARRFLVSAVALTDDGTVPLELDERGVVVPESLRDSCVRYRIDIGAASAFFLNPRLAVRFGDTLVASADMWMLRPERWLLDCKVRLGMEVPKGAKVSVPWPKDAATGDYVLAPSAVSYRAYVAVGDLAQEDVAVPGGTLHVSFVDGAAFGDRRPAFGAWLEAAAKSVATMTGVFPVDELQVLVVPMPVRRSSPVLFGQVVRGGHPGALLLVDAKATADELVGEWVAVHEFSHLALPFVTRKDAWLSEGMATYYQQVLRARAGLIEERDAWEGLLNGFERSRDGRGGWVGRTYWQGAAFALLADLELRKDGASTLDSAIAPLRACCFDDPKAFAADAVLDKLDEALGKASLRELRARTGPDKAIAALDRWLDELGVQRHGGGVRLDDSAPLAPLRRAIMSSRHR
jgi:hypothetical protein